MQKDFNNVRHHTILSPGKLLCLLAVMMLMSCSATKFLPEDEYLLEHVAVEADHTDLDMNTMKDIIRQKGNSRWFSLFKVPLATYSLAGRDTSKWINRTLQSLGEPPVVYDSLLTEASRRDLCTVMQNMGYLNADVKVSLQKNANRRLRATYTLLPGSPYYISAVNYVFDDSVVARVLEKEKFQPQIHPGDRFDVTLLDTERKRITSILANHGFYKFNKEFISFFADTVRGKKEVDLTLTLAPYQTSDNAEPEAHAQYRIGKLTFSSPDSVMHLRRGVLADNCRIEEGQLFSDDNLQRTYHNFGRLQAVKYTNIRWTEHPEERLLECDIQLSHNKPNTISFQPEGTNTAGDLGAAASLTYQNRNLFRGAEVLSIELRGAFEAIKGLKGYTDQDYKEYSVEGRLTFPRMIIPFLSANMRRNLRATSEVSVSYNMQNRPEFHRRVTSAAWRYRWSRHNHRTNYKLDLLNVNYVSMPWISETFKREYLDNANSHNAVLRYNYENLFIMNIGFGLSYINSRYAIRLNVETAGNLLDGVARLFRTQRNEQGQHSLFLVAYAQYAKFDFDVARNITIDPRNTLVLHAGFGVAYPYGNSRVLPYEKRYFAGGPNSVRGWAVRGLGPGTYSGQDGRINFINQTGDLKLDLNVEYRTFLFWKLYAAVFVDAGNIWTLRNYEETPGGQFRLDSFYKQIAASYGLGLRLNFNFFVLRFDAGMKAVNPAYTTRKEHFPVVYPNFKRDFAFHFAVGMPF